MLDGRLREEQAGLRERHQAAQRRSELLLSKLAAAVSAVSSTAVPGSVLGRAGGAGPAAGRAESGRAGVPGLPGGDAASHQDLAGRQPPPLCRLTVLLLQCGSGHPVCEPCRRSPLVRACPTCRQPFIGGQQTVLC